MIPNLGDFISAVRGAWNLLLWNREGMDGFDVSIDGFWRSFIAPVAAFPAFLLYALGGLVSDEALNELAREAGRELVELPETGPFLMQLSLLYVLGVILFPLLMVPVSRQFGLSHRYIPYIVAWNWMNALLTFILAVPVLLLVAGLLSAMGTLAISFVIYLGALAGLFFAAWTALQTKPHFAVLFVGLDIILGLLLRDLSSFLFGF